jgi:hypothetical protein
MKNSFSFKEKFLVCIKSIHRITYYFSEKLLEVKKDILKIPIIYKGSEGGGEE